MSCKGPVRIIRIRSKSRFYSRKARNADEVWKKKPWTILSGTSCYSNIPLVDLPFEEVDNISLPDPVYAGSLSILSNEDTYVRNNAKTATTNISPEGMNAEHLMRDPLMSESSIHSEKNDTYDVQDNVLYLPSSSSFYNTYISSTNEEYKPQHDTTSMSHQLSFNLSTNWVKTETLGNNLNTPKESFKNSIESDSTDSESGRHNFIRFGNDTQLKNVNLSPRKNDVNKIGAKTFNIARQAIRPSKRGKAVPPDGLICRICNDVASGYHFGVVTCNGCKGFFRRSIRNKKGDEYICRNRGKTCSINGELRNSCRSCRFRKCIQAGMKCEAVQVKRDSIEQNRQRSYKPEEGNDNILSLTFLLEIDQTLTQDIQQSPDSSVLTTADLEDIYDSLESQLFMYLRWVKSMPILKELKAAETISILRANAPAYIIMELAWLSRTSKTKLILQNGCAILRLDGKDCDRVVMDRNGRSHRVISDVATKIINEIVKPFADLKLDQKEFVCLKALTFFDPYAVPGSAFERVLSWRRKLQKNLENYLAIKSSSTSGRLSDLLLILPYLRSLSTMMIEKFRQVQSLNKTTSSIVNELFLGESGTTHNLATSANSPLFDLQHWSEEQNFSETSTSSPIDSSHFLNGIIYSDVKMEMENFDDESDNC